jgi:GT2 family glycosyltransferase
MKPSDGTPAVHVVILNWNGGHTVCETIDSVLSSDYPHTNLIVVDNASTDGSDARIERQFPNVTLIRNDANLGFAAGNNKGIAHALQDSAAYILLLNNDALVDQAAIQTMVSALATDPGRGAIVPKIHYYRPGGEPTLWAAGAEWRRFPPRVTMRGFGEQDVGQYDQPGAVDYATACALLIRRETFQQAGLFDESYFMYQEDYAFCDRVRGGVRGGGLKIWYEPRALVYHHVSASTGEGSPAKWHHWAKGISLFYIQHYGGRARAIAPLTTFLLWVMMRELAKGRLAWFRPFWRGVRAGWAEL